MQNQGISITKKHRDKPKTHNTVRQCMQWTITLMSRYHADECRRTLELIGPESRLTTLQVLGSTSGVRTFAFHKFNVIALLRTDLFYTYSSYHLCYGKHLRCV